MRVAELAARRCSACVNRFPLRRDLRKQQVDALPDHLRLVIAEHALAGGVEGLNDTVLIDREHHILDVIEDDLQLLGALLTRLVRHRARLVRHEPHRFGDPAPLAVERVVVVVDQLQQHRNVRLGPASAQLQFPQLRAQLRVQLRGLLAVRPRLSPYERSGGASRCLLSIGTRPKRLRI